MWRYSQICSEHLRKTQNGNDTRHSMHDHPTVQKRLWSRKVSSSLWIQWALGQLRRGTTFFAKEFHLPLPAFWESPPEYELSWPIWKPLNFGLRFPTRSKDNFFRWVCSNGSNTDYTLLLPIRDRGIGRSSLYRSLTRWTDDLVSANSVKSLVAAIFVGGLCPAVDEFAVTTAG